LLKLEINLLQNFPPENWTLDLPRFISFHFGYPYFYPIAAEEDNKIVGFGNCIINDKTGWLGNILVPPEYRGKGIGNALTKHLVEYFKSKGCSHQLLIASEMGKNIYNKIGFEVSSTYLFFDVNPELPHYQKPPNIEKISNNDFSFLKNYDEKITGEKRYHFIKRFFPSGWIYKNRHDKIEGVLLPELGSGLIFSKNPEVGLELLKFKLSLGKNRVVIPSENQIAIDFMKNNGFEPFTSAPRMVLGNDVKWQPENIYNRAAGYCG
jgi:GNAT superfamily N-acetyltransferase